MTEMSDHGVSAWQNFSLHAPLTALSNICGDEEHNKTGFDKQLEHVAKKGVDLRLETDFWGQCF